MISYRTLKILGATNFLQLSAAWWRSRSRCWQPGSHLLLLPFAYINTSLYFYLKSHIFELLQHTMEKNSTSRSGTTSNLYCLFGVTVIKLCQCWVPSQVDVTLRYSILLLPPFATSFLSYNSHRKHFLSCGFSLVFFLLCVNVFGLDNL